MTADRWDVPRRLARTSRGAKWLALLVAVGTSLAATTTVAGEPLVTLESTEKMLLLLPDSGEQERASALAKAKSSAQSGNGAAAFVLGALYRSGRDHPARAVARDVDVARDWLERCVDLVDCPAEVLSSLAELELAEGNAKRAMQWAQMASIFEREIDRESPNRRDSISGYLPGLLMRVYATLPEATSTNEIIAAWTSELVKERGDELDRMLDSMIKQSKATAAGEGPQFVHSNRTYRQMSRSVPLSDAHATYLVDVPAQGGRASQVAMIEGVPTPRDARGLVRVARLLEFDPFTPDEGRASFMVHVPIMLDSNRLSMRTK